LYFICGWITNNKNQTEIINFWRSHNGLIYNITSSHEVIQNNLNGCLGDHSYLNVTVNQKITDTTEKNFVCPLVNSSLICQLVFFTGVVTAFNKNHFVETTSSLCFRSNIYKKTHFQHSLLDLVIFCSRWKKILCSWEIFVTRLRLAPKNTTLTKNFFQ
jgi:hypothetical protein